MKHEIYEPREDSIMLSLLVKEHAKGSVLDMGTGSGIQALAAKQSPNVKSVLAVDLNEDAVDYTQKQGINAIKSDLFSNIKEKFDTIIFNPPYLPEDLREKKDKHSMAVCGGKHGHELIERFFSDVSEHLNKDSIILLLFSDLTTKQKVDEIIQHHLFQSEELTKKTYFFEAIYVYKIKKTKILEELETNNITKIKFLAKGKRGYVFSAELNKIKVAIKVQKDEESSIERIKNEAQWLGKLNKEGIGPKLYAHGNLWLAMEFVEGERIIGFIEKANKKDIQTVLTRIFEQLFKLDKMKVSKKELTYPYKHIIITKGLHPVLIDFERAKFDESPSNISQFTEFITSSEIEKILERKGLNISKEQAIAVAKLYKKEQTKENFENVTKLAT